MKSVLLLVIILWVGSYICYIENHHLTMNYNLIVNVNSKDGSSNQFIVGPFKTMAECLQTQNIYKNNMHGMDAFFQCNYGVDDNDN